MMITAQNIGIPIIFFFIAFLFLVKSYKKGHSNSYLIYQTMFSIAAFSVFAYFVLPITIDDFMPMTIEFKEHFYYYNMTDCLSIKFWIDNMGLFMGFCSYSFFSAIIFEKNKHFKWSMGFMLVGMVLHTSYRICMDEYLKIVLNPVNLREYIVILVGHCIGFLFFKALYRLNAQYINETTLIKKSNKIATDEYEYGEL